MRLGASRSRGRTQEEAECQAHTPAKTSTQAWAVSESDHRAGSWQDLLEGFPIRDLVEAMIKPDPSLLPPHPWF